MLSRDVAEGKSHMDENDSDLKSDRKTESKSQIQEQATMGKKRGI